MKNRIPPLHVPIIVINILYLGTCQGRLRPDETQHIDGDDVVAVDIYDDDDDVLVPKGSKHGAHRQ
jgi:hypothetical protein